MLRQTVVLRDTDRQRSLTVQYVLGNSILWKLQFLLGFGFGEGLGFGMVLGLLLEWGLRVMHYDMNRGIAIDYSEG